MRLFKVTACIPSPEKVRTQRELQNTFFTKWVPYDLSLIHISEPTRRS